MDEQTKILEEVRKSLSVKLNGDGKVLLKLKIEGKEFSFIPNREEIGVPEDTTVLFFGKYEQETIRGISDAQRKRECEETVEKLVALRG